MARRIADRAKVRLVIEGVVMQTTAKALRRGAISSCLYDAWSVFEAEHAEKGIIGIGSTHRDRHLNRDVQIQIDLY